MPGGRPSKYSKELAIEICNRMAEGNSLLKICSADDMPGYRTIMTWRLINDEFRQNYARAQEARAEYLAEECLTIADDKTDDILDIKEGGDTRMITNSAAVARAKLQVDTRKWAASQMAPKNWGQQNVTNTVTGADGGPVKFVVEIVKDDGKK